MRETAEKGEVADSSGAFERLLGDYKMVFIRISLKIISFNVSFAPLYKKNTNWTVK